MLDKGAEIDKQRDLSNDYLSTNYHFVRTSAHPSWQGKIRCRYCTRTGYTAPKMESWWGKNHGFSCRKREWWEWKNARTIGIGFSTGNLYVNNISVTGNYIISTNSTVSYTGRI